MKTTNRLGKVINSALGAAVGIAAPAVIAFGATTAHADDNYQQFASPSGSIRCIPQRPKRPAAHRFVPDRRTQLRG